MKIQREVDSFKVAGLKYKRIWKYVYSTGKSGSINEVLICVILFITCIIHKFNTLANDSFWMTINNWNEKSWIHDLVINLHVRISWEIKHLWLFPSSTVHKTYQTYNASPNYLIHTPSCRFELFQNKWMANSIMKIQGWHQVIKIKTNIKSKTINTKNSMIDHSNKISSYNWADEINNTHVNI